MDWAAHGLYALAWASFGLGHSVLANASVKRRLHTLGHSYRLAYNAVATVHIALVFAAGHLLLGEAPPFPLPVWARAALFDITGLGVALMLWSARYYDMARLAGTRQLREPDAPEDEDLRLDGPHRYVRHPFYATGLLIVWGLAQDPLGLATALWASVYLVVGAAAEEHRLLRLHGRAYAEYRQRIPGFIPAPLIGRRPLSPQK
ncbi:isoprenylcysteine carboxylmethyltransferase family protein [Roseospira marina]|uniref:Isoprenylcysteine carboxylmethyltransferase family protein n=1 Tax=Roseospira marina TaxID=140057 RepID=A0A5M6I1V8_9PROT|nr:isoprenylcysteine carboxylmethyltransferase family protein [Roseospira marina]KAA5602191.1 isoprenylcysteine carboxylmethyltransferase family protein [Roseospira marina]MBB4316290.1 protein-S-isoprenylcysteine O-methyltransferase Ste14 [Roseospira marina]MBB5089486.1 protein-S-isoprenylcysteine O-methyltransferase Ste14 [Roseospira marina]